MPLSPIKQCLQGNALLHKKNLNAYQFLLVGPWLYCIFHHLISFSDVPEGVILKPNLTEAIKAVNESPLVDQIDNVYVIGGAGVYKVILYIISNCVTQLVE